MQFVLAVFIVILIIIASYLADRKYPQKRIYTFPQGLSQFA